MWQLGFSAFTVRQIHRAGFDGLFQALDTHGWGGVTGRFEEIHYKWCGRDNTLCISSLRQPQREKKTGLPKKLKNKHEN